MNTPLADRCDSLIKMIVSQEAMRISQANEKYGTLIGSLTESLAFATCFACVLDRAKAVSILEEAHNTAKIIAEDYIKFGEQVARDKAARDQS